MVSVEVYDWEESSDETAAVKMLRDVKGLDDYHAKQPFGQLYWHRRPFAVEFSTPAEAQRFAEQLRTCGYLTRVAP